MPEPFADKKMKSELAQRAEIKRQEFLLGLVAVDDVIRWADSELEESGEYVDGLANVSLFGSACSQDLVALLQQLASGADQFEAMRSVLGSVYRFLLKDDSQARRLAGGLEHFWIDSPCELPGDMQFIIGLEEDFGLAEDGIRGTREEAVSGLLRNLARFDPSANQVLEETP